MAITPFVFAPFGSPGRTSGDERSSTELSFTRNFDISKPAVMVFFAHGYGVTLERDVVRRQAVLQQLEKAGLNAVLVAPQLAYNERSDSPGRFAERGFAQKFFDEAAQKLAQMHDQQKYNQGRPSQQTLDTFRRMPIIVTSYSGGYGAANAVIEESMRQMPRMGLDTRGNGAPNEEGLAQRVKGAVLLDTLYGGGDTYRRFAQQSHRPFVVSNYIPTNGRNLTAITNVGLLAHFAETQQLARGMITPERNVRIYQESGDHNLLVQDTLAKSLSYVPGYRVAAAPAMQQPQNQQQTKQQWQMHRVGTTQPTANT